MALDLEAVTAAGEEFKEATAKLLAEANAK